MYKVFSRAAPRRLLVRRIPLISPPGRISFATSSVSDEAVVANNIGGRPQYSEPRRQVLLRTQQTARELIRRVPGTFDSDTFLRVKETLDSFHTLKATDYQSIDLLLKLFERTVREIEVPKHGGIIEWLCPSKYINRLLNLWKLAARKGVRVLPPDRLLHKLQILAKKLPELGIDRATYGILMDGIMHTSPPEIAPKQMEQLLEYLVTKSRLQPHLQPNNILYNQILEAWARSDASHAPSKIRKLFTIMQTTTSQQNDDIQPCNVTYNILLRFWASQKQMDEMDAIWKIMKERRIKPSPSNYAQACYGYCSMGALEKAETIVLDMMWNCPDDKAMVGECVQNLMMTYRDRLESCRDTSEKEIIITRAEDLFERIGRRYITSENPFSHKLLGTLLDIYANAGAIERTEQIVERFRLNPIQTSILLKSYGKSDPEKATTILQETLENPSAFVTLEHFHSVMNAWAESGLPDSFSKTTSIMNLMGYHPRCADLEIRPNSQTFGILLKCLAASEMEGKRILAINLLDEMERRYRLGEKDIAPNVICYALAIKCCSDDLSACTALLERMKQNQVPLHVRVYNEILLHWSKIGTEEAVEKSEMILKEMWEVSKKQSQCRPDAYSYNLVLTSIRKLKDLTNYGKAWKLYEEMVDRRVEANMYIYTSLITHLSSFLQEESMERADQILQVMEGSKQPDIFPDYRHYSAVIRGWLDVDNPENATKALMRSINTHSIARRSHWIAAPDAPTIDRVVQGWMHVGNLESASMIVEELKELKKSGLIPVGPDDRTVRCLLDAWERSKIPSKTEFLNKLTTGGVEEEEVVQL